MTWSATTWAAVRIRAPAMMTPEPVQLLGPVRRQGTRTSGGFAVVSTCTRLRCRDVPAAVPAVGAHSRKQALAIQSRRPSGRLTA